MAAPRISSGLGYIGVGCACLALGLFASAGGSTGLGGGAIGLAAALIALGFWVGLAHKIELRLMDIERRMPGGVGASEDPAGDAPVRKMTVDEMPPLRPGQRFD